MCKKNMKIPSLNRLRVGKKTRKKKIEQNRSKKNNDLKIKKSKEKGN